jgi:polyribonucleotide nucleotidyltransferase
MFKPTVLTAKLGEHTISVETGRMAKQAHGSVIVSCGESMVLVTVVTAPHKESAAFFPMVVDYIEKQYAAGKIPGGFLKREGRLSDGEVLTSRLIDRPLRPLFPEGFKGEVQVTATVISYDGENDTATLAMTGASAALMLSPSPFDGPVAGVRVGRLNGKFIANPTNSQVKDCDLVIVMACSEDAIQMVEGEAQEVSEADMLDAIDFGFKAVKPLLKLQRQLAQKLGMAKIAFVPKPVDDSLVSRVQELATPTIEQALATREKAARYGLFKKATNDTMAALGEAFATQAGAVYNIIEDIKARLMREQIVIKRSRIDGRGLREIRPITPEVSVLPRTHGSALFTRGETQALVALTLGTGRDAKMVDGLSGKHDEHFMLHYNFPSFSVGEIKMLRGPGRREVGHGFLAQRALEMVLPSFEEFPYVIRVVSEVLESNGSSSMATVCGGSMALMDGGVPLKGAVAGIAMGLIAEGEKYAILSDILGDEDHLGDMDFKVAGTRKGITALQMDIKIRGLSRQIMSDALDQARDGRMFILQRMADAIGVPRLEMSKYAPRITTIQIPVDRIRDVIGSGGKTIRSIQERTGCAVEIDDTGTVRIASTNDERSREAVDIIRSLTASPVVGEIYLGTVAKVAEFGAFVTILPGVDGLCHISELSEERVERTEEVCKEGDDIIVRCIGVEPGGKIRLSRKEALGHEPTVMKGSAI